MTAAKNKMKRFQQVSSGLSKRGGKTKSTADADQFVLVDMVGREPGQDSSESRATAGKVAS